MKKLLALTLAILMTFGTTFVFAAESEKDEVFTVYLGNVGDDGNSGTSKDSPVATLATASSPKVIATPISRLVTAHSIPTIADKKACAMPVAWLRGLIGKPSLRATSWVR